MGIQEWRSALSQQVGELRREIDDERPVTIDGIAYSSRGLRDLIEQVGNTTLAEVQSQLNGREDEIAAAERFRQRIDDESRSELLAREARRLEYRRSTAGRLERIEMLLSTIAKEPDGSVVRGGPDQDDEHVVPTPGSTVRRGSVSRQPKRRIDPESGAEILER